MNTSEIMSAMIFGDGGASKVEELSTDGGSTDAGKVLVVGDNGKIAASDLTVGEGEVAIDKGLVVNGAAADAKVVGDAIRSLNGSLGDLSIISETSVLNATPSSGGIASASNSKIVWAKCIPNATYEVTKIATNRFSVFFTSSKPAVGVSYLDHYKVDATAEKITIDAPSEAKYICAYVYNASTDSGIATEDEVLNSTTITQITAYDAIARSNSQKNTDAIHDGLRDVTSNMFHINFPVSNMEIGAILETTGENGTNKTSRIRSTMYFPVKKGDVIRFLDTANVKTYVGGYMLNGQTYTYIGVFKHLSESDISEITIPENCYIRYAFGYIDDRNIGTDFDSRANLCKTMDVVRRSATKTEMLDDFEVGSIFNDVSKGVLHNINNFTRYRTENMYDVSDSDVVQIEVPVECAENALKVNIMLYNSDFTELSIVDGVFNADNTFGCLTDGYSYASAVIFYTEDFHTFKSVKVSANKSLLTSKLPANGNNSTFNSIGFNYMVQDDAMSTGRLILPPNYDKSGKAVPLVVFVHGSGAMLNWNSPMPESYINFLRYLANEGFAVFDCYPWTTKADVLSTDTYSPIMIPLSCRAYLEGIKYVGKRFNVDINNTCLLCKSQGGNIGHWAYIQSEFPFRAVGLFAPATDPGLQETNAVFYNSACRQAIINTVDFNGTDAEKEAFVSSGLITDATVSAFMGKNKGKFVSMMPISKGIQGSESVDELYVGSFNTMETVPEWMLEEGLPQRESSYDLIPAFAEKETYAKNAKCPVKFWCAFDDANTSSYGSYAIHRYLLNGGSDSEFRILPVGTGGHHAMDTSANALKSSGVTYLGIPYTDIPTAYVEFVQFASRYVR